MGITLAQKEVKMNTSKTPLIYYVCDRMACHPCNPDCKYTRNVAHAKNFIADSTIILTPRGNSMKKLAFFEGDAIPASALGIPVIGVSDDAGGR